MTYADSGGRPAAIGTKLEINAVREGYSVPIYFMRNYFHVNNVFVVADGCSVGRVLRGRSVVERYRNNVADNGNIRYVFVVRGDNAEICVRAVREVNNKLTVFVDSRRGDTSSVLTSYGFKPLLIAERRVALSGYVRNIHVVYCDNFVVRALL